MILMKKIPIKIYVCDLLQFWKINTKYDPIFTKDIKNTLNFSIFDNAYMW
jgi:hypothetical protein